MLSSHILYVAARAPTSTSTQVRKEKKRGGGKRSELDEILRGEKRDFGEQKPGEKKKPEGEEIEVTHAERRLTSPLQRGGGRMVGERR